MRKTFTLEHAEEMSNTIHVTGNPFSEQCLSSKDFARLDEVWRTDYWDENRGAMPPRPLTDAAIQRWREDSSKRMIVHYMQPHYPFIATEQLGPGIPRGEIGADDTRDVWHRLEAGEVTRDEVWTAYRANLQLVLDDVMDFLLKSVDANRVVLTADHGNALGELGTYGHPKGSPLDCLRTVPWVETTASDSGEYTPDSAVIEAVEEMVTDSDVDSRLRALGYT